jgi:uncharacterized protein YicC (UPF0701 family)
MQTKEEIQQLLTNHTAAQEARRAIERELNGIEGEIKSAISLGRADEVIKLNTRKAELPRLLVDASGVESAHAHAYYRAQRERTYELVEQAQDEFDAVEGAYFKRKAEVEKELARLEAGVQVARNRLGAVTGEHQTWCNHLDNASAGYHRALEIAAKAL